MMCEKIEGKSPEQRLRELRLERDVVISACERRVLAIDVKIDAVKAFIKPKVKQDASD